MSSSDKKVSFFDKQHQYTYLLELKELKMNPLILRPTKDIIGIQLCGAVKNIIAIAAGILKEFPKHFPRY